MEHIWLDDQDGLILIGDVLAGLKHLDDNSMEAIVTDPPYGLEFMGKDWDKFAPNAEHRHASFGRSGMGLPRYGTWTPTATADGVEKVRQQRMDYQSWCYPWAVECLRVLKPGGYLLAFGGTRTHHRMWCAIEDAGFEVRDMVVWLYGQGFPKSHNVGAAIDRKLLNKGPRGHAIATAGTTQVSTGKPLPPGENLPPYVPESAEAQEWDGWGTALKPACEPILLARKPLSEKTVAANVLKWGTGALNIDGTRIPGIPEPTRFDPSQHSHEGWRMAATGEETAKRAQKTVGRWPANVMLQCTCDDPEPLPETAREREDEPSQTRRYTEKGATNIAATPGVRREGGGFIHEPDCPAGLLDEQSGQRGNNWAKNYGEQYAQEERQYRGGSFGGGGYKGGSTYSDAGGASRFFYCPKASKKERGEANKHPTVKPIALMRWLVRLVTPPEGYVLDPFCGSGSTLVAAVEEGHGFVGIDLSPEYCATAQQRIEGLE